MRIYQILEKYHMDKWFRKENLVVLVLTGILLSVIALPVKEKDSAAVQETGVAIKASEEHDYLLCRSCYRQEGGNQACRKGRYPWWSDLDLYWS